MCTRCTVLVLPGTPRVPSTGGLRLLPWVGLSSPLLKVLRVEVGMTACPVRAYASYCCLHLRLKWDIVVHLGRVDMCIQGQTRGVWLLPLVEGLENPPDIIHVRSGGVGRPCGRVTIPPFQYGVRSAGVRPSCGRLNTHPDLCFCLLHLPPGIRHQVPADGSHDPPRHVLAVVGVPEQGRSFVNQLDGSW